MTMRALISDHIQALAPEQGFVASVTEEQVGRIERVRRILNTYVAPADRLLLAVSGGADSMGMLAVLQDELAFEARRLIIGHVQHGIRPNERFDLELIRIDAKKRRVPVLVRFVDVPALAQNERLSLEAAARRLRYQALTRMADEAGCNWILTGHTLDDSAETVWMRMNGGAPWYERTGIPLRRGRILRPMLHVTREEVRTWVESHGVRYAEDETNVETRFQRNAVRVEMAKNREIWTKAQKQELAWAGQTMNAALTAQRWLARRLPLSVPTGQEGVSVGLAIDRIFIYFKSLTFLPVEVRWGDLCGNTEARLPSKLRRQIADMLVGTTPEARLTLPANIQLIRRGNILWLVKSVPALVDRSVTLGQWLVSEVTRTLTLNVAQNGAGIRLAARFAEKPMHLRNWRTGDRIKPAGRPEKNISDLLNEARLDPVARARTLVLADELGPIMMLDGTIAQRALPSDQDKEFLFVNWTVNDGQSDEN